ncbi:MAG: hypothetical protein ACM3KR_07165 [Deltaproteobacteria bacterium]
MFRTSNNSDGSIIFSPVNLNKDEFSILITGMAEKLDRESILTVTLYDSTMKMEVLNESISFDGNKDNNIKYELKNTIPNRTTNYKVSAILYSDGETSIAEKSQDIVIESSQKLITCTFKAPVHKKGTNNTSDPILVSYNEMSNGAADYSFPQNADYYNQNNKHAIDIVLPVNIMFKLDTNYKFVSAVALLLLTDKNGNIFMHCGNPKQNEIKMADNDFTISFNENWKNNLPIDTYYNEAQDFKVSLNLTVEAAAKKEAPFTGTRTFVWEPSADNCPAIKLNWKADAPER